MSRLEDSLLFQIRAVGLLEPEREVMFARPRRWRADFLWSDAMLICEVQGATWVQGRHSRGKGYQSDCEKLNRAQQLGYKYLKVTSDHVTSGYAIELLETFLRA